MSSESFQSVLRRLPRRLASSVASAMSIRWTQSRKRSMNHSTNGQASTAIQTGPGSARSQASILPVLFVLILSRLISPVASTAVSVTVHLCKSTPTND